MRPDSYCVRRRQRPDQARVRRWIAVVVGPVRLIPELVPDERPIGQRRIVTPKSSARSVSGNDSAALRVRPVWTGELVSVSGGPFWWVIENRQHLQSRLRRGAHHAVVLRPGVPIRLWFGLCPAQILAHGLHAGLLRESCLLTQSRTIEQSQARAQSDHQRGPGVGWPAPRRREMAPCGLAVEARISHLRSAGADRPLARTTSAENDDQHDQQTPPEAPRARLARTGAAAARGALSCRSRRRHPWWHHRPNHGNCPWAPSQVATSSRTTSSGERIPHLMACDATPCRVHPPLSSRVT